jgi:pilin isopeptide linkage protein
VTGSGTVEWLKVVESTEGASLAIEEGVTVNTLVLTLSGKAPAVKLDNTVGTLTLDQNGVDVTIAGKAEKVTATQKCDADTTLTIAENAAVDKLTVDQGGSQGSQATATVNVLGSVDTMILTQGVKQMDNTTKTVATLSGSIDELTVKQYPTETAGLATVTLGGTIIELRVEKYESDWNTEEAIVRAESGFRADSIVLAPSITNWTSLDDSAVDVPMLYGIGSMTQEEVLSCVSVAYDQNDRAELQARLEEKEDGTVVVRVVKKAMNAVFLDGENGNDDNSGTENAPLKTLAAAIEKVEERAKANKGSNSLIYVIGEVEITDEQSFNVTDQTITLKRGDKYTGYLLKVTGSSGSLTLEGNIIVDGNKGNQTEALSLILVNGGSLTIEDGVVLQNNSTMQEKHNYSQDLGGGFKYLGGGAICLTNRASATMNGGTIQYNKAYFGGGVYVGANSSFTMIDGEISNNEARYGSYATKTRYSYGGGGGVCICYGGTMNMTGGSISSNNAWAGGGISVGVRTENSAAEYNVMNTAESTLTMEGGKISDNTAKTQGGGIYIQVNCEATISGGMISENTCEALNSFTSGFGGGGIYVNGISESNPDYGNYLNGILYLTNVEISGNCAASGAAVAGCPTSNVKIYVTDGAVIHDNTSKDGNYVDVYMMSGTYGAHEGDPDVSLSAFMLGGAPYNWTDADGNTLPLNDLGVLTTVTTGKFTAKTTATEFSGLKSASVHILNNSSSNAPGGGIASNGDVVIGTANDTTDLTITKEWVGDDEVKRPDSVDVDVLQSTDGETWTNVGFVRLSEENNWTVNLRGLPATDENGKAYQYQVSERAVDGYVSVVSSLGNSFTVTNIACSEEITISGTKTMTGRTFQSGDKFSFTISAVDDAPLPVGTTVQITPTAGESEAKFSFDPITFTKGGTYQYIVTETVEEAERLAGVTYDATQYLVTVTVAAKDDRSGVVTTTSVQIREGGSADQDADSIVFRNSFSATETSVSLTATKTFDGGTLTDGLFSFELEGAAGAPMPTSTVATNTAAGTVTFGEMTFTYEMAGSSAENAICYPYVIREVIPDDAVENTAGQKVADNVIYDTTEHQVNIYVYLQDDGRGGLAVQTQLEEVDGTTFNNGVVETIADPGNSTIPTPNPGTPETPTTPDAETPTDPSPVTIPDEQTPLAEEPETPEIPTPVESVEEETPVTEIPVTEIPDEQTPLADQPEAVADIPDEQVPLGAADETPNTGDTRHNLLWMALCLAAGLALFLMNRFRDEEREEN